MSETEGLDSSVFNTLCICEAVTLPDRCLNHTLLFDCCHVSSSILDACSTDSETLLYTLLHLVRRSGNDSDKVVYRKGRLMDWAVHH